MDFSLPKICCADELFIFLPCWWTDSIYTDDLVSFPRLAEVQRHPSLVAAMMACQRQVNAWSVKGHMQEMYNVDDATFKRLDDMKRAVQRHVCMSTLGFFEIFNLSQSCNVL
jgi:hypothetical protein